MRYPGACGIDCHFQVRQRVTQHVLTTGRNQWPPSRTHPGIRQQILDQDSHPFGPVNSRIEEQRGLIIKIPAVVPLQHLEVACHHAQRFVKIMRGHVSKLLQIAIGALQFHLGPFPFRVVVHDAGQQPFVPAPAFAHRQKNGERRSILAPGLDLAVSANETLLPGGRLHFEIRTILRPFRLGHKQGHTFANHFAARISKHARGGRVAGLNQALRVDRYNAFNGGVQNRPQALLAITNLHLHAFPRSDVGSDAAEQFRFARGIEDRKLGAQVSMWAIVMGGDFLDLQRTVRLQGDPVIFLKGTGNVRRKQIQVSLANQVRHADVKQAFKLLVYQPILPFHILHKNHGRCVIENDPHQILRFAPHSLGSFPFRNIAPNADKAGDLAIGTTQRSHGQQDRKPRSVLPDVSPFVFIDDVQARLGHKGLEARCHRAPQLLGKHLRALLHFCRIVNDRRRHFAYHLISAVAQLSESAPVDGSDDAVGLG